MFRLRGWLWIVLMNIGGLMMAQSSAQELRRVVAYCHEVTESLTTLHKEVSLLQTPLYRLPTQPDLVLNLPKSAVEWEIAPLPNVSNVSSIQRAVLQRQLTAYIDAVRKIQQTTTLLQRHISQEKYRADEGKYIYTAIGRLRVLYEDTRTLHAKLNFTLNQAWPFAPSSKQAATQHLTRLTADGHALMAAIRRNQKSATDTCWQALRVSLADAKMYYRRSNTRMDAASHTLFAAMIQQTEALLTQVRVFRAGGTPPDNVKQLGWRHHQWHGPLMQAFGEKDEGLLGLFDTWASTVDTFALPSLQPLPWWRIVPPPTVQPIATITPIRSLENAPPQHWVLLVDVSASMRKPGRLSRFQTACATLLTEMRPNDQLSVVTFAGKARSVIEGATVADSIRILSTLAQLAGDGKTDIDAGFAMGYSIAHQYALANGHTRLGLVTDGEFAMSSELLQMLEAERMMDVGVSIFYVGTETYTMERRLSGMAQVGGGIYQPLSAAAAADDLRTGLLWRANYP